VDAAGEYPGLVGLHNQARTVGTEASMKDDMSRARALVERLQAEPGLLPFPAADPQLVETHSSWVLLCGADALKIKKPVHMGFIDFSSKVRRDRFAREEIRLNRRVAPELYLGVLPITGTPEAPRFDGRGPLVETAVHMRQFDPANQLDVLLERDGLTPGDMDELAAMIAGFQAGAPRAEPADPWGRTDTVLEPIRENFRRIREAAADLTDLEPRLAALEAAGESRGRALALRFAERRAGGFVREGHGDLHLGNLARTRWGIRAFDCLEFAPQLRWIDVVSDLAFLFTDLLDRGRGDLGWRLLNAWTDRTGDHAGLQLLPLYALYRIMVRVKVAALRRAQQTGSGDRAGLETRIRHHLEVAERIHAGAEPGLVLMHGLSGSGKSRTATRLAERLGAVHLRSDLERKRLLDASAPESLYGAEADALVYRHLESLSQQLLAAGHRVIVDATLLRAEARERFVGVARRLDLPVAIVACEAPLELLLDRVRQRAAVGTDPSDAGPDVVLRQRVRRQPPTADEADLVRLRGPERSDENADVGAIETLFGSGRPGTASA
jgi:hypothetical protein